MVLALHPQSTRIHEVPASGPHHQAWTVQGSGIPQPDKPCQHIMFIILEAEEPDESKSDEPEAEGE